MTNQTPAPNKRYRVREGQAFRTLNPKGVPVTHYSGDVIELPDDVAALHAHRLDPVLDEAAS